MKPLCFFALCSVSIIIKIQHSSRRRFEWKIRVPTDHSSDQSCSLGLADHTLLTQCVATCIKPEAHHCIVIAPRFHLICEGTGGGVLLIRILKINESVVGGILRGKGILSHGLMRPLAQV